MKVFKFGGASVKDSTSVRNVRHILSLHAGTPLVVVISAMGKITNHLEKILASSSKNEMEIHLNSFKNFHRKISEELKILDKTIDFIESVENDIRKALEDITDKHELYDRVVSSGELLSTYLISIFLNENGVQSEWIDTRKVIKTTNTHKNANVDWQESLPRTIAISKAVSKGRIAICQGFIGSNSKNSTTTLGREGSDYSAAILAYLLNAEEVCIWKDVSGMLNADPKYFENTVKLEEVSYREAIELAYYGASVIHPKTVKPLQNKDIPLYIKSFKAPEESGTVIKAGSGTKPLVPSYIFKPNQLLVSISPKDFSFVAENHLTEIFKVFSHEKVAINLMQNSALNFSVVVDQGKINMDNLLNSLEGDFFVKFNEDLELITIRHFNEEVISELSSSKSVFLEQRSRNTLRLLVK